jgi:hypothetical protein
MTSKNKNNNKEKKKNIKIITNEFFEDFEVVSTVGSNPRESWAHLLQTWTNLFPTSISCDYNYFNNSIAFLLSNNWY